MRTTAGVSSYPRTLQSHMAINYYEMMITASFAGTCLDLSDLDLSDRGMCHRWTSSYCCSVDNHRAQHVGRCVRRSPTTRSSIFVRTRTPPIKLEHPHARTISMATPICTTVVQIKRARLENASRTTLPETLFEPVSYTHLTLPTICSV